VPGDVWLREAAWADARGLGRGTGGVPPEDWGAMYETLRWLLIGENCVS
jgi:hypothetical protein